MNRDERHQTVIGWMILIVLFVLVGVGISVLGGRGGSHSAPVRAVADVVPTDQFTAATPAWYASTGEVRGAVATAVGDVRREVAAADGTALRPACSRLASSLAGASAFPGVPLDPVGTGWRQGLADYTAAGASCGQLWDGTARTPADLLGEITRNLDAGDAEWRAIGARLSVGA
jgi:hypothetical protein